MANYKSFNTEKQKLPKLWELSDKDEALLNAKENILKKLYKEKGVIKSSVEIFDSGWIPTVPTDLNTRTVTQGTPLPSGIDEDITISNIRFPEDLLAFLTLEIQYRSAPDVDIVPASVYNRDTTLTNYVEVYGDNELIYKGVPRAQNFPYTQANLVSENFLESHTKKMWKTTIGYMDAGSEWRFQPTTTSSAITQLIARYNISVGCSGNENSDTIDCFTDMNFASARNTDKILNLDSDGFTVIGRLTEERFTGILIEESHTNPNADISIPSIVLNNSVLDSLASNIISVEVGGLPYGYTFSAPDTIVFDIPLPPTETVTINYLYCGLQTTITDGVEVTLLWGDLESYSIRQPSQLFKKIGASFVLQSSGDLTFNSSTVDSILTTTYTFVGYWLFYDTDTVWLYGISDTGDVDILNDDLQNLPDTTTGHGIGHTLPYTTITLQQNFDMNPYTTAKDIKVADDLHTLFNNRLNSFTWLRTGNLDNDGVGIYTIKPLIKAIVMEKASVISNTNTVNIFNDAYTISGTTYAKSSEEHEAPVVTFYKAPLQDLEYRVRLVYKSPFVYFKHEKPHEI